MYGRFAVHVLLMILGGGVGGVVALRWGGAGAAAASPESSVTRTAGPRLNPPSSTSRSVEHPVPREPEAAPIEDQEAQPAPALDPVLAAPEETKDVLARQVSEVASDPRNTRWASQQEALLQAAMQQTLAEAGVAASSLRDVECRSTRCRATIAWPESEDAMSRGIQVANRYASTECAISVTTPEGGGTSYIFTNCGER